VELAAEADHFARLRGQDRKPTAASPRDFLIGCGYGILKSALGSQLGNCRRQAVRSDGGRYLERSQV